MTGSINVIKRNGNKELLDYEKINKVLIWATEDISNVSASEIAMNAKLKLFNKITTNEIHKILIKSSAELINVDQSNYQYVTSKLVNYLLRKDIFNTYKDFPSLSELIKVNIGHGVYDNEILDNYTEDDLEKLEKFIKHDRDEELTYAGIQQLIDKYLIRNRDTGEYYETPQFMYMVISMVIYSDYTKEDKLKKIKELYDYLSQGVIQLPTPIIAGVRTPNRQYSSCVLIDIADDLDSIGASNHATLRYISNKAGLGLNFRLRGIGSSVNNGEKVHTGIVPFVKMFESAVKSCSQGGIRGGAATAHYPFWHYEIESIIKLKNNKGNDLNRARRLDHSIQMCRLFYRRFLKDEDITLFQPNEVPDLYEAFGIDNDLFEELYDKYERSYKTTKKKIRARELMGEIATERIETGRIYIQNLDNANTHSSFLDKITMSNLCQEINLPTSPFKSIESDEGEIALCILAALNLGKLKHLDDLEKIAEHTVYFLDKLIDIQEYLVKPAEKMKKRRSIGVGVTNLAYWKAKNGYDSKSKESLEAIDELFESVQYFLLKASNNLAKEYGACEYFNRTKYSKGLLPIDHYNKNVDKIVSRPLSRDWEILRANIIKYGLRNSTLTTQMPCESSSLVTNSSNGAENIRDLLTVKQSKAGLPLPMVLPEAYKLKNKYERAFDVDNTDQNNVMGIIQKWIDQGISVNHYYNKEKFDKGEIPLSKVINDIIQFYQLGGKQLYYANSLDNSMKIEDNDDVNHKQKEEDIKLSVGDDCEGGACAI